MTKNDFFILIYNIQKKIKTTMKIKIEKTELKESLRGAISTNIIKLYTRKDIIDKIIESNIYLTEALISNRKEEAEEWKAILNSLIKLSLNYENQ